jgi:hypothetical protein
LLGVDIILLLPTYQQVLQIKKHFLPKKMYKLSFFLRKVCFDTCLILKLPEIGIYGDFVKQRKCNLV